MVFYENIPAEETLKKNAHLCLKLLYSPHGAAALTRLSAPGA